MAMQVAMKNIAMLMQEVAFHTAGVLPDTLWRRKKAPRDIITMHPTKIAKDIAIS